MKSRAKKKNNTTPDSELQSVARIHKVFEESARVLIVTHRDPDGDAIGSQLAFTSYLRDIGIDAVPIRDDAVPDKYLFLSGIKDISEVDQLEKGLKFDTILFIECPTLLRGSNVNGLVESAVNVINIDHHLDNHQYGTINWVDSKRSSVGEMAYEYFCHVGYEINPVVAEYLYAAILTDTGRFRYPGTTPRTMEIAARLIEAGADPQKICDQVYYNMSPSSMKLFGRVLSGIEFLDNDSICLLTLTREMLTQSGATQAETEGLVDYTMFSKGVKAGALFREINEQQTKVSLRSKGPIDVAAIASHYGGGGHSNAAGCVLDMPLDDTRRQILYRLSEAVHD